HHLLLFLFVGELGCIQPFPSRFPFFKPSPRASLSRPFPSHYPDGSSSSSVSLGNSTCPQAWARAPREPQTPHTVSLK
ncbi:hypothetical protein BZA05DRAFT_476478, partial [Tricharina praecox]|uniref:uncharacterized protein n=1 Tax=Tricharina praecox TaxID=43433 RepID=UPI00221E9D12